jgi:hypothetical protein
VSQHRAAAPTQPLEITEAVVRARDASAMDETEAKAPRGYRVGCAHPSKGRKDNPRSRSSRSRSSWAPSRTLAPSRAAPRFVPEKVTQVRGGSSQGWRFLEGANALPRNEYW